MKVFGLTKRDDSRDFYRIVQPLRFLKRNGNDCVMLPYQGEGLMSALPVHDKLLLMLSKNADVILASPIHLQNELLRALDLRKVSGAKLVIDVAENLYEVTHTDSTFQSLYLADGLIVSNERLKKLYQEINPNILVLPSGIDFKDIEKMTPCVDGDLDLIKEVLDKIKIPKDVALLPLRDNNYTRCLDNIRLLRYCANKIACVASPVEGYKDIPMPLAASNYEWYDELEKLKDKKYREATALKGYEYAKNFDMKKLIKPVKSYLEGLKYKKI